MKQEPPDNGGRADRHGSWWQRLRNWFNAAFEPPGRLTRRIDDPPDWSPDDKT